MNYRAIGILMVLCWICLLSACTTHPLDALGIRDETIYPATYPVDHQPPPKTNGSIYQAGYDMTLYPDHIAARVGDLLTVRLEEQTQGEKKAKTKTNKLGNYAYGLPTIGKPGDQLNSILAGSSQQFDGEGESNQQNKLQGTISVTVMRLLSNGNVVIQGESWVTIDQGREYIRLTGIVRPEDIDVNNTVSSQRVADARIAYSGNGQTSNASQGGFIYQFMNKFFPY